MKKIRILLLIAGGFVLFLTGLMGCARTAVSIKGEPPQYVGIGEFENPNQGINAGMYPRETARPSPSVPVITHAYAVDRGIYGTILKIYIEAEDPKGEMSKIATTVDQVAYGHYPTDFIILKSQYRKSFRGYIQWNTFSPNAANLYEWSRVFVTVAVIDKAGRTSNQFIFPFTFETGVAPASNPPAPFDEGTLPKIGSISIDLYNPYHMGGGAGGGDIH